VFRRKYVLFLFQIKYRINMKKLGLIVLVMVIFISCKEDKKSIEKNNEEITTTYISFGDKITSENYLSKGQMYDKFKSLKKGDTLAVKFASKINKSCKKKGCWMRLDLGNNEESLVRFKDYGFFVPLNSKDREVIVSGKAYLDVVTVAQLRHYAEDEGLSKEEINKITEDEVTFAVESNGVLMKQ